MDLTNRRIAFHNLLLTMGTNNVYYQPPSSMKYPCILYERDKIDNKSADDSIYKQDTRYSVTVISKNADDIIVDNVSKIPQCEYDREFKSENLYHTVFNIYY